MTATGGTGNASNKSQTVPHEVQVIQAVLKDMGVTDYEPAVVNQLLDFTYRKFVCLKWSLYYTERY